MQLTPVKIQEFMPKSFFDFLKHYSSVVFFIIVIGMLLSALLGGIGVLFFRFVMQETSSWIAWQNWALILIGGAVLYAFLLALYDYLKSKQK